MLQKYLITVPDLSGETKNPFPMFKKMQQLAQTATNMN